MGRVDTATAAWEAAAAAHDLAGLETALRAFVSALRVVAAAAAESDLREEARHPQQH